MLLVALLIISQLGHTSRYITVHSIGRYKISSTEDGAMFASNHLVDTGRKHFTKKIIRRLESSSRVAKGKTNVNWDHFSCRNKNGRFPFFYSNVIKSF